eukprot:1235098-Rhodomonas_salina.3
MLVPILTPSMAVQWGGDSLQVILSLRFAGTGCALSFAARSPSRSCRAWLSVGLARYWYTSLRRSSAVCAVLSLRIAGRESTVCGTELSYGRSRAQRQQYAEMQASTRTPRPWAGPLLSA